MRISDEIRQYEKKIYDQRQLIEISRALNSTLNYDYLIEALLDICMAHVQTLQAAMFLPPEIDSEFISLVSGYKGFDFDKGLKDYNFILDGPLIRALEKTDHSFTIEELQHSLPRNRSVRMLREDGVELIVPLKSKGKMNGLIVLGEKMAGGTYPSDEMGFLEDLASLGGIAVENARLFERATMDLMTGIKNHAYFQGKTKEERERALKRKTELALIVADLDYFKNVNDTYGHQAGDAVLRAVAQVFAEAAPRRDLAARYGGEEFCVLVPGLTQSEIFTLAELTRKRIGSMQIDHDGNKLKVTASMGISFFDPERDRTNKTLVERADQALFMAKRSGRNRIAYFSTEEPGADSNEKASEEGTVLLPVPYIDKRSGAED